MCVTNHFSKEKSELEVNEAVMTGIDMYVMINMKVVLVIFIFYCRFCLQLDELWEMSINYYLEGNGIIIIMKSALTIIQLDFTQESNTLHKQLQGSTEVQKDSLKKKWIEKMAEMTKQVSRLN